MSDRPQEGLEVMMVNGNVIGKHVDIGVNFNIGHFCVIEDGVVIGNGAVIGSYVHLKAGTKIGHGVILDSYVRSSGSNEVGDGSILKYGVTIARNVIVRENVFISPNVMTIYMDAKGDPHQNPIIVGEDVFIGTATVINFGIKIADRVKIGAMSYVTKNCDVPGAIYVGSPARMIKRPK